MLRPVASLMRTSASGLRPMPRQVGSTTVRPPAWWKASSSATASGSSSRAQLWRLTKGSIRSSPTKPAWTGSVARGWRSGSPGLCHQQRQSFRMCSCGSVTPIALAGMRPRTVITWLLRTWASLRSSVRGSPQANPPRRGEQAGVEPDRGQDDRTGHDLGEEGRDVGEDQAVADHRDGERAQDAAEDGAAAAHERGAAKDHGRDHVELEADRGVGGAAAEAGGDDDAGE